MNFLNTNIKTKFHYIFLFLIILMNLGILSISNALYNLNEEMDNLRFSTITHNIKEKKIEPVSVKETNKYTVREVSAYNVGIVNQNDGAPCIGAGNHELCSVVNSGKLVCAANFVPLHTKLSIEGIGECEVMDRMNSRYKNRVDLAMRSDEYTRAVNFGVQHLKVAIK